MQDKSVSIIIPVYNAEKFLSVTLDSVMHQTHQNWECIVVDDGSTDTSGKILLEYCKKDKRFKYYRQLNSGPSIARNYGTRLARGEYIQYLDADDVIMPERIKQMIEFYEEAGDNVILYSSLCHGDSNDIYQTKPFSKPVGIGHDIYFKHMYRQFLIDFMFTPSCPLFPRSAVSEITWNENLSHSEDWDYYLRILENDFVLRLINIPLVIYRNTPNSLSKNNIKTIEANYFILNKWSDGNLFFFSKRCALLFKRSIIRRILNKSDCIIKPKFKAADCGLRKFFFIVLIYPLTFFFLIIELLKITIAKIKSDR